MFEEQKESPHRNTEGAVRANWSQKANNLLWVPSWLVKSEYISLCSLAGLFVCYMIKYHHHPFREEQVFALLPTTLFSLAWAMRCFRVVADVFYEWRITV